MLNITPAQILHDDEKEQTRIVELSTAYEGMTGCYHSIERKLAIFELEEVVLQWHGGMNAPMNLRFTFAEMDALIHHFNAYCEAYNHPVAECDPFEWSPPYDELVGTSCTCPDCTSQDSGSSFLPSAHCALPLALRQVRGPFDVPAMERCTGSCYLCSGRCSKGVNHHNHCYCAEHK